jgi:hypothetical protein
VEEVAVSFALPKKTKALSKLESLERYLVGKTPLVTLGPPLLIRGGFRLHLGSN